MKGQIMTQNKENVLYGRSPVAEAVKELRLYNYCREAMLRLLQKTTTKGKPCQKK